MNQPEALGCPCGNLDHTVLYWTFPEEKEVFLYLHIPHRNWWQRLLYVLKGPTAIHSETVLCSEHLPQLEKIVNCLKD